MLRSPPQIFLLVLTKKAYKHANPGTFQHRFSRTIEVCGGPSTSNQTDLCRLREKWAQKSRRLVFCMTANLVPHSSRGSKPPLSNRIIRTWRRPQFLRSACPQMGAVDAPVRGRAPWKTVIRLTGSNCSCWAHPCYPASMNDGRFPERSRLFLVRRLACLPSVE